MNFVSTMGSAGCGGWEFRGVVERVWAGRRSGTDIQQFHVKDEGGVGADGRR